MSAATACGERIYSPWLRALSVRRHAARVPLASLIILAALACAACGEAAPSMNSTSPVCGGGCVAVVTFAPDTSYSQAQRLMTDLGFQVGIWCGEAQPWQPMNQAADFAARHALAVVPVHTLVADWLTQVRDQARVTKAIVAAQGNRGAAPGYTCPASGSPLTISATGYAVAQIRFGKPLTMYDAALASINNLGLALAASCIHTIVGATAPQSASSAGEEQFFAATSTLIVMTVPGMTATTWQQQLSAMTGVEQIQTHPLSPCT